MLEILTAFQKAKTLTQTRWKRSSLMVLSRLMRPLDWTIRRMVLKTLGVIRNQGTRLPRRDEIVSRGANPSSPSNSLSYPRSLESAYPRVSKDIQRTKRYLVLTTSLILSPGSLLPIGIIYWSRRILRKKRNHLAPRPSLNWRMISVLLLLGGLPSLCLKERDRWAKLENSKMEHPFLAGLLNDRLLCRSKIRSRKLVKGEISNCRLNTNLKAAECWTRCPMDNNFLPTTNKGWAISRK